MWDRLLFAIDQFESGQTALHFVAGVASANEAGVRVLHIRDVPRMAHAVPLEAPSDAEELERSDPSPHPSRTAQRGAGVHVGLPGTGFGGRITDNGPDLARESPGRGARAAESDSLLMS